MTLIEPFEALVIDSTPFLGSLHDRMGRRDPVRDFNSIGLSCAHAAPADRPTAQALPRPRGHVSLAFLPDKV